MPLKDQIKNYAKKLVESRPDAIALRSLVRVRKPLTVRFLDDGIVPNNPRFPLLFYRGVVTLTGKAFDPATIIDTLFESNGWGRSWRDTVYDFVHYHSQIHEVMGVARGTARVECGGIRGRILTLKPGDVVVLPAGTGHRLIEASRDFVVVGAYPEDGTYDECTDTRDRAEATKRIAKVRRPAHDPVYGKNGPLTRFWRGNRSRT
ncbi:MAG: cupin [Pseudolabrys sp.]